MIVSKRGDEAPDDIVPLNMQFSPLRYSREKAPTNRNSTNSTARTTPSGSSAPLPQKRKTPNRPLASSPVRWTFTTSSKPTQLVAPLHIFPKPALTGSAASTRKLTLIHIAEPTRQAEISYAVSCLKKKKSYAVFCLKKTQLIKNNETLRSESRKHR